MSEVWNPVVGYEERYMVSNFGQVKSLLRKVLTNLEWVTRSENSKHAFRTGLQKPTRICKITESDVRLIRAYIIAGRRWAHI